MVWIGFGYVVTGLFVGGVLAGYGDNPGVPFNIALLAIFLGMFFLTFITSFLGIIAQKTGLSLALLSRYSYRYRRVNMLIIVMVFLTIG